jgi:hypothetical protein
MASFLLGGRTGDLVHSLYVAKHTEGKHNLYITDRRDLHSDGFALGLEKTYEELYPILMAQDYVESFEIYNDQHYDKNLSMWRRFAYSTHWAQLLSNTFNVPVKGGAWIEHIPVDENWKDVTAVHCSIHDARKGNWSSFFLDTTHVFIGDVYEYMKFGGFLENHKPRTLLDMFIAINSCKHFIGNQSAPLAIAHALDVPRTGILNPVDAKHYVGEENVYSNFKYVL